MADKTNKAIEAASQRAQPEQAGAGGSGGSATQAESVMRQGADQLRNQMSGMAEGLDIEPGERSALFPVDWQPGYKIQNGTRFLQDYSYAGYKYGEEPPTGDGGKTVYNVAPPTGTHPTDVDNINNAIDLANANAAGGIVQLAAGTDETPDYVLRASLNPITRSGVVLRGAGATATKLRFTNATTGNGQHSIKFAPTSYTKAGRPSAPSDTWDLVQDYKEFDDQIKVKDASGLSEGDEVHIGWKITEAFTKEHHPGTKPWWGMQSGTSHVATNEWRGFFRRTIKTKVGNVLTLDVPLRYKVKLRDTPSLKRVTGYLQECGLESLGISNTHNTACSVGNPPMRVDQHSAILFEMAKNYWVRNIKSFAGPTHTSFHLRSHGITIKKSRLMTVMNTRLERSQKRETGATGTYSTSRNNVTRYW
jgi:hypothetical protein